MWLYHLLGSLVVIAVGPVVGGLMTRQSGILRCNVTRAAEDLAQPVRLSDEGCWSS